MLLLLLKSHLADTRLPGQQDAPKDSPHVFSPPGVHGRSVRLHGVSHRVQERSGLRVVAQAQALRIQGSHQISSRPGPVCRDENPRLPAGSLRHVPALSVWHAFPGLPQHSAGWVSLPPQRAKGGWAGGGAAAAGAHDTDC